MPPKRKAPTKCNLVCCRLDDEARERIRVSTDATRGKSMFPDDPAEPMPGFGPMCRCGVRRKPPGLALHVQDDGLCTVHPDLPAQPWTKGAG